MGLPFIGSKGSGGGGGALSGDAEVYRYADYATAVAAAGSWSDGDFIITDDGLVLRYWAAVTHASGLAPAYPFGLQNGLVTAVALIENSFDGGQDPRTTSTWSDSNCAGVENTDWQVDITGGTTTVFKKLTATGAVDLRSSNTVTSGQTIVLQVIDGVTVASTQTATGTEVMFSGYAYKDATDGYALGPVRNQGAASADTDWAMWQTGFGLVDTNITPSSGETIWSCVQNGFASMITSAAESYDTTQTPSSTLQISGRIVAGAGGASGTVTLTVSGGVSYYALTLAT